MSKFVQNDSFSSRPMRVPDEDDIVALEKTRISLATEIEALEKITRAKESATDYQQVVLDSYRFLQMTERAVVLLDPRKPDFLLNFAILQGRWKERMSLTEEVMNGKRRTIQKKSILLKVAERLKTLTATLQFTKQSQGKVL